MLTFFRASRSNIFVWAIIGLLIVGLAGFSIGAGGGGSTNVARVGDQEVSAETFARTLDQEMRAISTQVGRNLTVAEAQQFGIDRSVLARLVADAALDEEAARVGVSVGDDLVREQVLAVPAFAGADGAFDRETYTFVLQRTGMDPAGFEALLRREITRETLAGSVQAATALPQVATDTVLGFLGERRSIDWVRLDGSLLETPVPAPTDAELAAEHEANPERYTRPETRRITYAALTPAMLAAGIEVPEAELRAAYEAEPGRFGAPERRILDRIGFGSAGDAEAARARLDAGEITFDALAAERGLSTAETDQGEVAASELGAAAEAVFGADGPGIVGPVETALGPSIYRVNAILGATMTPFEEAREELRAERALRAAGDRLFDATGGVDDLLAGGATLEEIAAETEMEIGTIELNTQSAGGLADDPAFVTLANGADEGVETDLAELETGGIVTLRVEAIEPPALIPLAEVRDRVAADWTAARTAEALEARAVEWTAELDGGLAFGDLTERLGAVAQAAGPLTRSDVVPGLVPEVVADVFELDEGAAITRADGDGIILVQLTSVEPFDPESEENAQVLEGVNARFRAEAAQDLLSLYTAAIRDEAGVSVNQNMINAAITQLQ